MNDGNEDQTRTEDATPMQVACMLVEQSVKEAYDACNVLLDEINEDRGERQAFFVQSDHPTVRYYGVQDGEHHAVFPVAVGFDEGSANFNLYVGEPQLREGTFDLKHLPGGKQRAQA